MSRVTGSLVSLALLLVFVVGCGMPGVEVVAAPSAAATLPASAVPSQAAATRLPSPGASASASPGVASASAAAAEMALALGPRSLSMLRDGAWREIVLPAGGSRCQQGSAVFGATGGLVSCAGRVLDEARSWAPRSELFNHGRLFAAPDGNLWAWGSSGVKLVAADGTVSTPRIGVPEVSYDVVAAAFEPDGRAWFAQRDDVGRRNLLLAFDGRRWRGYGRELGMQRGDVPATLLQTARGELLAGDTSLYRFAGDRFIEVLGPEAFQVAGRGTTISITALDETPDGTIWIATDEAGLFSWDGVTLRAWGQPDGLTVSSIRDLAVAGDGTLWVATVFGLAHRAGDGFVLALPSTNGPADSFVQTIAVRGAPLLPPIGSTRVASLAGSLLRDDAPLAEALIELCAEPPDLDRPATDTQTPCAGQAFQRATVTGADGAYSFLDVPLATYVLVVVPAGGEPTIADWSVSVLREGVQRNRDVVLKIEN